MKIDGQMDYWAHMLDESFPWRKDLGDHSYYAMWKQEFPEYADQAKLQPMLAKMFDKYMKNKFASRLDGLLKRYVEKILNENIGSSYEALPLVFDPNEITDTDYFWHRIPARVYKAMVSRNRAKSQGAIGHEVSPKVLKDCLDDICCSANIMKVHSTELKDDMIKCLQKTDIYKKISEFAPSSQDRNIKNPEYIKRLSYMRIPAALDMTYQLYCACTSISSFKDGERFHDLYKKFQEKYPEKYQQDMYFDDYLEGMVAYVQQYGGGDWSTNDTDSEVFDDIIDDMKEVRYDIYEDSDKAIPLISKLVDYVHARGDLAGAFIEGGAATCWQTSNMKPDELWENSEI